MKNVDQVLSDRHRLGLTRLRTALIAAACLHLGVAAAVAVGTRLGKEDRELPEFVAVRVVPAAALGRPEPPPPEPRREPEPKTPEPEPEPEPTPEPPDPEPPKRLRLDEVDVSMPPEPAPEPEPRRSPPPRRPPPSQRQGSPHGNPLATSALGSQMGVDNPDFTYDYYLDRLLALIEARWRRPGGDPPNQAVVHFRVHRDGGVTEVEILDSSGSRPFDLAALRAVESATPFPPLPTSYRKDSLGISLIVY